MNSVAIRFVLLAMAYCVLPSSRAHAQAVEWQQTYGGSAYDNCGQEALLTTADGGYLVGGRSSSYGLDDQAYVVRTDSVGSLMWFRTYGGSEPERIESADRVAAGGYVLCGTSASFGTGPTDHDLYLIRLNDKGDTLWTRTYGGTRPDIGRFVRELDTGGFVLAGITESGVSGVKGLVVRTDPAGDTTGSYVFGTENTVEVFSGSSTPDGYLLTGFVDDVTEPSAAFLAELDESGDLIWMNSYPLPEYRSQAFAVERAVSGGYIVTGRTARQLSPGVFGPDSLLIMRIGGDGEEVWRRSFGGLDAANGFGLAAAGAAGFLVTGFSLHAGNADIYLLRLDAEGDTLWTTVYGGSAEDVGMTAKALGAGAFIVAGETASFGLSTQVSLARIFDAEPTRVAALGPSSTRSIRVWPVPSADVVNFDLGASEGGTVRLSLFDVSGRLIRTLTEDWTGDDGASRWDGRDENGSPMATGTYYAVAFTGRETRVGKLVLLR